MDWMSAIRGVARGLTSICILAAVLDLFVQDDGAAFGFHMACGLAIALVMLRSLLRVIN